MGAGVLIPIVSRIRYHVSLLSAFICGFIWKFGYTSIGGTMR